MVYSQQALDSTFAALADPTRRAMLERLSQGEASVLELARPHQMSLPAVSKHLGVLERARLIERRKDGRVRRCRLAPGAIDEAARWIETHRAFWEQQFDSLSKFLTESERKEQS